MKFKIGDIVRRSVDGYRNDQSNCKSRGWTLSSLGKIVDTAGDTTTNNYVVIVTWEDDATKLRLPYNLKEIELVARQESSTGISIDLDPERVGGIVNEAMQNGFAESPAFSMTPTECSVDAQIETAYSTPERAHNMNWAHFTTDIGRLVWESRRAANMKRKRLAKLCGLTKKAVKLLESGEFSDRDHFSLTTLFKIFEALGLYPKLFAWERWNRP